MTLLTQLPAPIDDGACDHLRGLRLPPVALLSTSGEWVDVSALAGRVVLYCYPMTGRPDRALPAGWDHIPGARGCTPQSCAFRDHYRELQAMGAEIFGLSTQGHDEQCEASARLHLPFPLLSDSALAFASALRLPLFEVDGMTLTRRLTLITNNGVIEQVFYPVFPPDRNADDVMAWLATAVA